MTTARIYIQEALIESKLVEDGMGELLTLTAEVDGKVIKTSVIGVKSNEGIKEAHRAYFEMAYLLPNFKGRKYEISAEKCKAIVALATELGASVTQVPNEAKVN